MPTPTDARTAAVMADLTARFVADIEAGLADPAGWTFPIHRTGFLGGATNAATGKRYTGGNAWLLAFCGGGPWATYRQWQSLGAQVRKGETGTTILRPRMVKREDTDRRTGETRERRVVVGFSTATVFAAAQVDGWTPPPAPAAPADPYAVAAQWYDAISAAVPVVTIDTPEAFYVPATHTVHLPARAHFTSTERFYATAAHEYAHASGHASLLARDTLAERGRDNYAREELVAELAAAVTCHELGITADLRDSHRDYLASWLRALKNDPGELWRAAGAAQRAATWVLSFVPAAVPDAVPAVA